MSKNKMAMVAEIFEEILEAVKAWNAIEGQRRADDAETERTS